MPLGGADGLLLLTAFTDVLKLWLTPSKQGWQSYIFWPLFRTGLGLTILLGVANPGWRQHTIFRR